MPRKKKKFFFNRLARKLLFLISLLKEHFKFLTKILRFRDLGIVSERFLNQLINFY